MAEPCKNCASRRVGCHIDCPAGKAQDAENAAKREYLRKHGADVVLCYGAIRRKKKYG